MKKNKGEMKTSADDFQALLETHHKQCSENYQSVTAAKADAEQNKFVVADATAALEALQLVLFVR